jgi:hypothetical protein
MEKPFTGRATISDNFDSLEITIPTQKNWLVILFVGAWIGGWSMGEMSAAAIVFGRGEGFWIGNYFVLFWLIAWTAGGILAIKMFLDMLLGKETITVDNYKLTLGNMFLKKAKAYDLNEAKNFRIMESPEIRSRRVETPNENGVIGFDYGLKTIRFGLNIDELEAKSILQQLKNKGFLTAKNF